MVRFGHSVLAARRARLNLAALSFQSGCTAPLKVTFTQRTGRPPASIIILSITRAGHEGSPWEIMSFVPRAITRAVGFFAAVNRRSTTVYDSLVLRPRL